MSTLAEPQHVEMPAGDKTGEKGGGGGGGGGNEGAPTGGGRTEVRGGKKSQGGNKASRSPATWSLPTNMTPTFYIGGSNGNALVEGPLLALGWKRIIDKTDTRYKLKWAECKSKINYSTFKEGEQLVNHIPNGRLLTNKLGLLCSLQEYERVTLSTKGRLPRLRMIDFFPETYRLDNKEERTTFLEQVYKEGETWICKPTDWNQGKGIFLLRSRQEIDQLLEERDAKRDKDKYSIRPPVKRLVQRYITDPLLLEGRKFDIRAYMLIASTMPYLILFHHGYIRLSCNRYDGDDTNLTTHLTNQYIQKKDPSYQDVKESTAWSMDKFNDYINTHYAADKGIEEDWTFKTLTRHMQRIVLHCFNSVKHKLQCKMGYFDLYGLDFMIDGNMKVWLIEINVNPSLATNCEALKGSIPGVVKESLYVAIEAFEKTRRNQPLLPLQSLRGFQILHCGSAPFNVRVPRQSRSVSPVKRDTSPSPERSPQALTTVARNRRNSSPRGQTRMNVSSSVQVTDSKSSPYVYKDRKTSSEGEPDGGDTAGPAQSAARATVPARQDRSQRYSAPERLPRMKLFAPEQISPYMRSFQGGNPGGLLARSSQPSLPSISYSNTNHQSASRTTTTTHPTATTTTVTIVFPNNKASDCNSNNGGSGQWSLSHPSGGGETENGTVGGSSAGTRKTQTRSATSDWRRRDKPDRGN